MVKRRAERDESDEINGVCIFVVYKLKHHSKKNSVSLKISKYLSSLQMRRHRSKTRILWFDYDSDEKAREAEDVIASSVVKSKTSKRKYEDTSFYGGVALYKDATSPPNGFPHADDVEWGRLCVKNDISSLKYPTSLFIEGSEPGDVIQGILGNCWFVSAMVRSIFIFQ